MEIIKKSRKFIAVILIVLIGIIATTITVFAEENAAPSITAQQSLGQIAPGKELKFTIKDPDQVHYVLYAWNRRIDGNEREFIALQQGYTEYEFKINAPTELGLHEFSIAAQDYAGNVSNWIDIPYVVVKSGTEVADTTPPQFIYNMPDEYPYHDSVIEPNRPITIKLKDTSRIYYVAYKWVRTYTGPDYSSGVTMAYDLAAVPGQADTYSLTINAKQETGVWYLQMFACDGANNITDSYYTKLNIKKVPSYTAPSPLTATYGQTLGNIAGKLPTGFTFQDSLSTKVGNVGTNTFKVKYTPTDTTNYMTIENIEVSIEVSKANPEYEAPSGLTAVYGDTLEDVELPEGFTWNDELTTSVGNAGAENIFMVTYTPVDTTNYNIIENIEVSIEVSKADPTYEVPSGLTAVYGDTLEDVTLPEGFSWDAGTTTSVGDVGTNTFMVTYTPVDTTNYNTVSGIEVTVEVLKPEKQKGQITITNAKEMEKTFDGEKVVAPIYEKTGTGEVTVEYYNEAGNKIGRPSDMGKYTVKVILAETEYYSTASDTVAFEILKGIGEIKITNAEEMNKSFDGNKVAIPKYTKTGSGEVTVKYYNEAGEEIERPLYIGKYTVEVTLAETEYYSVASDTATFKISKGIGSIEITNAEEMNKSFDKNKALIPEYTKTGSGKVTVEYYEGTEASGEIIERPVNAGTYTVKVILEETEYYLDAFDTATFKILKINGKMTIENKDAMNKQYDGKKVVIPEYTKEGSGEIIVEYYNGSQATGNVIERPANAGIYTVKVIKAESTNYNEAFDTATFEISKGTPSYEIPTGLTATYGDTLANVQLSKGFAFQDPLDTSVGNVGENTFKVTYTPTNTNNYEVVTDIVVAVNVSQATPDYVLPDDLELKANYGDTLGDIVEQLPEGLSFEQSLTTPVGDPGENLFNLIYTPKDTINYSTLTFNVSVTVNDYIEKIEVVEEPDNAIYKVGDVFDITGLIVQTVSAYGITQQIDENDIIVSQPDMQTTGRKTITVMYDSLEANFTILVVETLDPVIKLNGLENMEVEVYDEFKDPGAIVYDAKTESRQPIAGSIYAEDGTTPVDAINTTQLGKYTIKYTSEGAETVVRTVEVVDTIKPVIHAEKTTITYVREQEIFDYNTAVTATDNYDQNVTITCTGTVNNFEPGTYYVIYTAIDSSENISDSVTITVIVKDYPPFVYYYDSDNNKIEIKDNDVIKIQNKTYWADKGTVTIRKNEGEFEPYNNEPLPDGKYTIKVETDDEEPLIINFIVDGTIPVVTGAKTGKAPQTIVFEDLNDVATATLKVGTADPFDLKQKLLDENTNTYKIIATGTYTLYVSDEHGNAKEYKFIIF